MSSIPENLKEINDELKDAACTLIAVSKTKPNEDLIEAYHAGQRHFGENKVQELAEKAEALASDIRWHMIGHLQRNKVKYIAPFVYLIHAVDSERLLEEINKQAIKHHRSINVLIQIHIADEDSKFGLSKKEASLLIEKVNAGAFSNIKVLGLMGMATNTDKKEQIRSEFKSLKVLFDEFKQIYNSSYCTFEHLSMGMSGDYPIAVEEGSTMIRVGSKIFGARNYN